MGKFKRVQSKILSLSMLLSHFQLCLTLCDPVDGSPSVSPVPGILQARTLEWVKFKHKLILIRKSVSYFWRGVYKMFSSVQSLSRIWLFATPWTAAHLAFLSITNSWSLLKLRSIESVMPSNHLILCCPLLLPPSVFPSIRVFSSESVLSIRWPKYWSFSFNISPSNGHLGLISFRMYWLDLLAVQGTLKSLLEHDSSKASILWCSAFFIV